MPDITLESLTIDSIPADASMDTASSISCWMRCQKLHEYKYSLGYRMAETIPAYLIGTAVHIGLESFWNGDSFTGAMASVVKFMQGEPYFSDAGKIERARIYAYLKGYYARWGKDLENYSVIGVEGEFSRTVRDVSGSRIAAGKLDALVRRKSDGQLIIIEHKTAGAFSKADDPSSPYWTKLSMDNQSCSYVHHIEELTGERPLIMYDIVLKSRSTPLKSRKRKKKDETDAEFQLRIAGDNESIQEYQARLANKYVEECSTRYFRQVVNITSNELEMKIDELNQVAQQIHSNTDKIRIRNTTACSSFGSACEFMGVCTGLEQLDDPKFMKKETAHEELQQQKEAQ